jgi:hypothetical protein
VSDRPADVIGEDGLVDVEADRGMNSDIEHYMRMAALHCHCEAICECDDSSWFAAKTA